MNRVSNIRKLVGVNRRSVRKTAKVYRKKVAKKYYKKTGKKMSKKKLGMKTFRKFHSNDTLRLVIPLRQCTVHRGASLFPRRVMPLTRPVSSWAMSLGGYIRRICHGSTP